MRHMSIWTALVIFFLGVPALPAGGIYTWTDEDGVRQFSDQKPEEVVDFEVIDQVASDEAAETRESYERMMRQVDQERLQRDLEREREAEARAEQERKRAEAERQARIKAERSRLERQIDELNNRALSRFFTQGMRDAQIETLREKIDELESGQ